MDSNKDGKTDLVDFVDMQTGDNISLVPTDGIWNYKTSFGIKKVDPSDEAYFRFYNMYLKAINSSLNGT